MKILASWVDDWKEGFEHKLARFLHAQELIESTEELSSKRFLNRSILPHVKTYHQLFNRLSEHRVDQNYWKKISGSDHFRTAYFLAYMPGNMVRIASVLGELHRLGWEWKCQGPAKVLELGAGPATAAAAWMEVSRFMPDWMPETGTVALVEKDKKTLELGTEWIQFLNQDTTKNKSLTVTPFHRTIDLTRGLLPERAPAFDAILTSFFLNEYDSTPEILADALFEMLNEHLNPNGLWIGVEPALKIESRKLLAIRKRLIERIAARPQSGLQILLPCLGHQSCGALAAPQDWCHEEVTWWRPKYYKWIDDEAGLDRKTLPFSYLVITKSKEPIHKLLKNLQGPNLVRLVSPSHNEGQDQEFFICGHKEKRRARYRTDQELGRGDILSIDNERGDPALVRIDKAKKI